MIYALQDIWTDAWKPWVWTVIPTNIGWTKDGRNPMGRGLAQQAAQRYPELPIWYGAYCRDLGVLTGVTAKRFLGKGGGANLILFPTKPLNDPPHLSWRQLASFSLIEKSLRELKSLVEQLEPAALVHLPAVGCGQGGLARDQVLPLMEKILEGDRFIFVGGRRS